MRVAFAFLPLAFLVLKLVASVESRKDAGEYWKMIKDMPEEIQGLVKFNEEQQTEGLKPLMVTEEVTMEKKVFTEDNEMDCKEKKQVVKEFEPRPNVSAYGDNEVDAKEKKHVVNDFEPRPNVSAYGDNDVDAKNKKHVVNDFEPRPNVSAYGDNDIDAKKQKKFVKSFEPRPNVSVYDKDNVDAK
ncbi:hypothetical protein Ahy_A07g036304 [Arachis hypogaea]|uniref:Organ-specific protein S2 n=1 Tax=Arachis hypogaea TaxID=3818 RepID=A0A445CFU1_ARAHY|nr:hypothetical protein Ahy_A07g036304 [Arachis hypogaea]